MIDAAGFQEIVRTGKDLVDEGVARLDEWVEEQGVEPDALRAFVWGYSAMAKTDPIPLLIGVIVGILTEQRANALRDTKKPPASEETRG